MKMVESLGENSWMVACLRISLGKSSSSLLNKEMMKTSQRVITKPQRSSAQLHNYNIKWLQEPSPPHPQNSSQILLVFKWGANCQAKLRVNAHDNYAKMTFHQFSTIFKHWTSVANLKPKCDFLYNFHTQFSVWYLIYEAQFDIHLWLECAYLQMHLVKCTTLHLVKTLLQFFHSIQPLHLLKNGKLVICYMAKVI